MRHSRICNVAVGLTGWLVVLGWASAVRADDAPDAVRKAHRFLQGEAKMLLLAAHPTAKLTEMECDGFSREGKNYRLAYTLKFEGIGGDYSSELSFTLNADGKVLSCKAGDTTSLVPQFFAADLAIDLLKDQVRKEIQAQKDQTDSDTYRALLTQADGYIRNANSKGLLEVYLKAKQARR